MDSADGAENNEPDEIFGTFSLKFLHMFSKSASVPDAEMLDERVAQIVTSINERYGLDARALNSTDVEENSPPPEHGLAVIQQLYSRIFGDEFSVQSAACLKVPLYNEIAWLRARVVESSAADGIIPKPVHTTVLRAALGAPPFFGCAPHRARALARVHKSSSCCSVLRTQVLDGSSILFT